MQLIKVLLTDEGHELDYNFQRLYFHDAAIWAVKHCGSFKRYDIIDVSNENTVCDQVAEYLFEDNKDVTLFRLRWR